MNTLRDFVFALVSALRKHLDSRPEDRNNSLLSFQLIAPFVAITSTEQQEEQFRKMREDVLETGFPGKELGAILCGVIESDKHIRECFVVPIALAFFINRDLMSSVMPILGEEHEADHLENLYSQFHKTVYDQGPFRRVSYTHIFNLKIAQETFDVGNGFALKSLPLTAIPELLNEPGLGQSFLHPELAGNVFFVGDQTGVADDNDYAWLAKQRALAEEFCTVLQYFKDGVISVGYSGIYFNPPFLNTIRKHGMLFHGEMRRRVYKDGTDFYTLSSEEMATVAEWLAVLAHPKCKTRMDNASNDLRATIERAGTYYETSHDRMSAPDRVIALAIAIEALFSPTDQGELKFRISQNVSMLLGSTLEERRAAFESIRKMYDLRSKLVHGSYDVTKYRSGELFSEDTIREWASYVRKSILAYIVLLLRGYNSRKEILDQLSASCFDNDLASQIQEAADITALLKDFSCLESV